MSRRGREASDVLTQALITMAAKGLRPHCSDPESHWMWLHLSGPCMSPPCQGINTPE
jgi:hypothetical protein